MLGRCAVPSHEPGGCHVLRRALFQTFEMDWKTNHSFELEVAELLHRVAHQR